MIPSKLLIHILGNFQQLSVKTLIVFINQHNAHTYKDPDMDLKFSDHSIDNITGKSNMILSHDKPGMLYMCILGIKELVCG